MTFNIDHYNFETLYSTNTWALQNFVKFNKQNLTVITAKEQSYGRGRLNHKWESPADSNIYTTFCLFIANKNISICNIPQILAISCAEILSELSLDTQLKWPNDILINNKKVAGILCETKQLDDTLFVATGIGLNINLSSSIINSLEKPATSLLVETGVTHNIESIRVLLEEKFHKNITLFLKEGFDPFYEKFNKKMYSPDEIQFNDNTSIVKGKALTLNSDGSLNLETHDGEVRTFHYGEIV